MQILPRAKVGHKTPLFLESSANAWELSILICFYISIIGGAWVKCFFNFEIDCPSYLAQKELGYEPNLKEIQEKTCPQCPKGPTVLKKNRENIRQNVPSLGNYIF